MRPIVLIDFRLRIGNKRMYLRRILEYMNTFLSRDYQQFILNIFIVINSLNQFSISFLLYNKLH